MKHDPSPSPLDEVAILLVRCASKDAHAFRRLYDLEADRLLGIAWSITKSRAVAADALHDAFVQVWNNAGQFSPERGSGQAWLTGLVRYRALDAKRRVGREFLIAEALEMEDPSPTPFEQLSATHEAQALARCLATLDAWQRRLLVLAYLRGLSHKELAVRVGQPLGTVKSTLRRTLRRLRDCLESSP